MITYSVEGIKHIPRVWSFPAGEVGVACHFDSAAFHKTDVDIKACITNSDDIMSLLMLTDSIRRMYKNAKINLSMGYVPYGRQDRVCNEGESLSIKVFANLINSQNYNSVQIYDPHSHVTEAVFDKCKVIYQHEIFNNFFSKKIPHKEKQVLIAPDQGASSKIKEIAKRSSGYSEAFVADKQRDLATGYITDFIFSGDVKGKHCTVVDDICDGGMTFILIGKALKEAGALTTTLCVTHGIFSKGHEVVSKWYDSVYTTNSYHKDRIGLINGVNYIEII